MTQRRTARKTNHGRVLDTLCPETGKVQYRSERATKTGQRVMRERGEVPRPYRCPHCGYWHLTGMSWAEFLGADGDR